MSMWLTVNQQAEGKLYVRQSIRPQPCDGTTVPVVAGKDDSYYCCQGCFSSGVCCTVIRHRFFCSLLSVRLEYEQMPSSHTLEEC